MVPARARGALAKGAKIRAAYNANPNHCLECGAAILARPDRPLADARRKKFCKQKCNADYQVKHGKRHPIPKRRRRPRLCKRCGEDTGSKRERTFCDKCLRANTAAIAARPRGTGPAAMRRLHLHAKTVVRKRPRVCVRCGYKHHAEGAHIRAVASFPPTATLAEVNAPANIIMFCPNCHWEFDHKLFTIDDLTSSGGCVTVQAVGEGDGNPLGS